MKKKALVLPAKGFGDGLLMMIVSFYLQQAGYETTIAHPLLHELNSWFKGFHFTKKADLFSFDRIIVQNDNSKFMNELKSLRKNKKLKKLSFFYGGYQEKKHGPLHPKDAVFDLSLPMADNIASSSSHLLSNPFSKKNGISPPEDLTKKKHAKRVVIHPLTEEEKNWPIKRFIAVGKQLSHLGYHVAFVMSPKQRKSHLFLQNQGFEVPLLVNLSDLASFIYESGYFIGVDSGPGHLASVLDIPSIIIASDRKHMKLWQPGWRKAHLVFPSRFLLNIKYLRLKEKLWKSFISPQKVLKTFQKII